MEHFGTKFIREAVPVRMEKPDPNGRIIVTYNHMGEEKQDEYDTVLFAIGRNALTDEINLDKVGIPV
jgi:pyruvate/2-oxoglutarate dehydrogenase complex dihydrolipoamide dehydrogenase (E3) component